MSEIKKVELLSPAGNMECFYGAIAAGADAVYAGGSRFGARAYAGNFTEEEFIEAIGYAHLFGRKLYMTLNTLMKEKEMEALPEYLEPYYKAGLDGVIVQDIGLISYIREHFPLLPVHASTQMAITGAYGAEYLKSLGAERIVPARELSLDEIKKIHDKVDIEIEVFIHGAMCYSYSGMCLMSSFLGGRSGNRGRCAGPCRQPYGENGDYILSMKDLCSIELLDKIVDAGAVSLKIEGRMKSVDYVAGVTSIYRKHLDMLEKNGKDNYRADKKDLETLLKLYSRSGKNTGYFTKHNGYEMITMRRGSYESSDELKFKSEKLRLPVKAVIHAHKGENMRLEITDGVKSVESLGVEVQTASKRPVGQEDMRKQLEKTGDSDFYFDNIVYDIDDDIFIPLKSINEIRREGLKKLREEILSGYKRVM